VVKLGHLLVDLARGCMVRSTLRLMRAPASAMGPQALQRLLEEGFDARAAMKDPNSFVATIAARESAVAKALFPGSCDSERPRLSRLSGRTPQLLSKSSRMGDSKSKNPDHVVIGVCL
jgi:hypothetical protein